MATRLVRDGSGNMAEADREAEWAKINRTQETTWTVQPFGQSHSIIISASPMLLFFLLANRDVGMRSSVSNPSFLLSA